MKRPAILLLVLLGSMVLIAFLAAQPAKAAGDYWIQRTRMYVPMGGDPGSAGMSIGGWGVATANGRIFAMSTGYYSSNQEYDPSNDSWTVKTPMPIGHSPFEIAGFQDKIYVFSHGATFAYDVATDTWQTKTTMPTPRMRLDANVADGKIYLIGGWMSSPSNLNEVYDPANDSWTTRAPIPKAVSHYASAVLDNRIYIISGYGAQNSVQIYDPATDNWTTGASCPIQEDYAAADATTGTYAPKRIYVFGGQNNSNATQVYDPQTNTWSLGAPMPHGRYDLDVAVVNDTMYVIGGIPRIVESVFTLLIGVGEWNEQYIPSGYSGPTPPIPEFPAWIALPVLVFGTVSIAVWGRKLSRQRRRQN